MSVTAARVTVSTTAAALNTASTDGTRLVVRNIDATDTCDLGPAGVTAGAGFRLANGESVTVDLKPGDVLYAIRSAAADVDLTVLRT